MKRTFTTKKKSVSRLNDNEQILKFIEKKYAKVPSKIYKNLDEFFNEIGH